MKSKAQLQAELKELQEELERQKLERQVKDLRRQVKPSKLTKVAHGLVFVGSGIVASFRAFDDGLKWLEQEADM
ncbi:MAG TPA: hypothetical protein VGS11_11850 [Candidatus Bathyarchaeia archaeon]|nr:hypothetical protein [Candidatus Bathyarchaeia archaeon]